MKNLLVLAFLAFVNPVCAGYKGDVFFAFDLGFNRMLKSLEFDFSLEMPYSPINSSNASSIFSTKDNLTFVIDVGYQVYDFLAFGVQSGITRFDMSGIIPYYRINSREIYDYVQTLGYFGLVSRIDFAANGNVEPFINLGGGISFIEIGDEDRIALYATGGGGVSVKLNKLAYVYGSFEYRFVRKSSAYFTVQEDCDSAKSPTICAVDITKGMSISARPHNDLIFSTISLGVRFTF